MADGRFIFFWSFLGVWLITRFPYGQAAEVPIGVELAPLQHLVINNGEEIATLDPHQLYGVPAKNVMRNLFEGLVNLDSCGQVVPGVAERWQQSADGKTWTFYLRPNARWSNGDPLTADDFIYSWRRLAAPSTRSPYSHYLIDLGLVNGAAVIAGQQPPKTLGVRAIDQQTLQLQCERIVPYCLKLLTVVAFYPVHAATVEQYGNGVDDHRWYAVSHFVGNGAYQLQGWVVNEKLRLIRNPHYWDNPHTVIDSATFLPIFDEVVDVRRYQAGEIDITHFRLPLIHFQKLQQQYPDELHYFPLSAVYAYQFNGRCQRFQDRRVRQALSMAVNRRQLVQQLIGQGERVAYTLTPPDINGWITTPPWVDWPEARRYQHARQLLKAAGYHADNPLQFTLLYSTSELHEQIAVALAEQWKQHLTGAVKVNFICKEWKVFLHSRLSGQYHMARNGRIADYDDPSCMLHKLRSQHIENDCFYQSTRFDDWLDRASAAIEEHQRQYCYQQAELQLAIDVPLIPLFHPVAHRLVKPYVGGLSERNPLGIFYIKDLYLIKHPTVPSGYRP